MKIFAIIGTIICLLAIIFVIYIALHSVDKEQALAYGFLIILMLLAYIAKLIGTILK